MNYKINFWGISAFLCAFGLLISNFQVAIPQWTYTICLILLLFIPEWGNNIRSLHFSELIPNPKTPKILATIGRATVHGLSAMLVLNRCLDGLLFPRFDLGFGYALANVFGLFLLAYILPYLITVFFTHLLWDFE